MKDNADLRGFNCIHCGAPVTEEICPYCGQSTGITSEQANISYPVIECNSAIMHLELVSRSVIIGFVFIFFGAMLWLMYLAGQEGLRKIAIASTPMLFMGLICFTSLFQMICRYIITRVFGKSIEGTVYGYVNDTLCTEGTQGKAVKILVSTLDGDCFLLYRLGSSKELWAINSRIKIKVLGNNVYIKKKV